MLQVQGCRQYVRCNKSSIADLCVYTYAEMMAPYVWKIAFLVFLLSGASAIAAVPQDGTFLVIEKELIGTPTRVVQVIEIRPTQQSAREISHDVLPLQSPTQKITTLTGQANGLPLVYGVAESGAAYGDGLDRGAAGAKRAA